jgi:DNA-binding transcriptional ArsR family regulator
MREKTEKKSAVPPHGTQTLVNFQQVRALAHPLRLRILGVLIREPRTTKQVADLLGEKHTKLYHHMQALERAKVIRLTGTRQKRGTMERYYQATAALFRAAPSVFSTGRGASRKLVGVEAMLNTLLESARLDVASYVMAEHTRPAGLKKDLLAARLIVRGSREMALKAVRHQLARSINSLAARGAKKVGPKSASKNGQKRSYAVTVILCPIQQTKVVK